MTEEREHQEPPKAEPPPHPGGETHANAQPAARPLLGEWRGPAFWMACGALLAGIAVGAVVLAQRVGVERDMMAVAATLPQPQAVARPVVEAPSVAASVPQASPEPVAAQPAVQPHQARVKAKAKAVKRHKAVAARKQYAEVFKRCPPRGEPGALKCRHDICNGAEREGPACRPYRGKFP